MNLKGNAKRRVLLLAALVPLLALGLIFASGGCKKTKTQFVDIGGGPSPADDTLQASLWENSPHADETAEAFTHWDDDGEISTRCAKCHSHHGFLDFLGADGTAAGTVDCAAELGSVITCETCHNNEAVALTSVTFPSGETITVDDPSVRCMQCHQGRESGVNVDEDIQTAIDCGSIVTVDDPSTGDGKLGFVNIHYLPAGATLFGNAAAGGYQYAGEFYDGKFNHVPDYQFCSDCHNPHSLEVKVSECGACHAGVSTEADLANIRMEGSVNDYDGDADATEGVKAEIEGLQTSLLAEMLTYATAAGTSIAYDSHSYPYFFVDNNSNGIVDTGEETRYQPWTARLLKAAYNYQYSQKDPGAYAHNAKYMIQLLYDAIEDLDNTAVATLHRGDEGHFDGTAEAFRHWDGDGEVRSSCARCHSSEGSQFFFTYGVDPGVGMELADGFACEVCHVGGDYASGAARRYVDEVIFPGGAEISNDPANPDDSFICMSCHQGRESMADIDEQILTGSYKFLNVHYVPAGAILYGNVAEVGYQYPGNSYEPQWTHTGGTSGQCMNCHGSDHSFKPTLGSTCMMCHTEATLGDLSTIRNNRPTDYDGDTNTTEPLADELAPIADGLYTEIKAYAIGTLGNAIVYGSGYPYWFWDENSDGIHDAAETTKYGNWDATLMKAAHNYQIYLKEHGAWAHNTKYIVQLLYDAMEDLNLGSASGAGFNRP